LEEPGVDVNVIFRSIFRTLDVEHELDRDDRLWTGRGYL
jgi:hypothetical protein